MNGRSHHLLISNFGILRFSSLFSMTMDLPVQNPPSPSFLMFPPVHHQQTSGVFLMDRLQETVVIMTPERATPLQATVCVVQNHQSWCTHPHYHFPHPPPGIRRRRRMNITPIQQVHRLLTSPPSIPQGWGDNIGLQRFNYFKHIIVTPHHLVGVPQGDVVDPVLFKTIIPDQTGHNCYIICAFILDFYCLVLNIQLYLLFRMLNLVIRINPRLCGLCL